MKNEFDEEKKQAVLIALELMYGDEVVNDILKATTSLEIGRILKQARLNLPD